MPATEFLLTGDLVLDEPDPDHWLAGIAPAIRAADVAVGHLEVPHTDRGIETGGDVPAPAARPSHLAALARAGFDVITLAGNHIYDCGEPGVEDTCAELARLGLAFCGAGSNIDEARRAAVIRRDDRRIAFLSYNCVGPDSSWATPSRAGCAYVSVTADDGSPISPAAERGTPDPESVRAMKRDIGTSAGMCDLTIVSLHKGIVHTPARLADYERTIAHAAIDAGADVVVGHHAHIVRGIEWYRDRPIFHGLGNGCVVTRALGGGGNAKRASWAQERRKRFGFEPDPEYPLAPFHPQAVNSMLARVRWHEDGRLEAGFVPVWVAPPGRPEIAVGRRAAEVSGYVAQIGAAAGLPALAFDARPDMVHVTP